MKNLFFSFFLDIFAKKGKPETFNYFWGESWLILSLPFLFN